MQRGLMQDDNEWRECLREAVSCETPKRLRCLFSILLEYNHPADPRALWNEFKSDLSEDFTHAARQRLRAGPSDPLPVAEIENDALWDIELMLQQQGRDHLRL